MKFKIGNYEWKVVLVSRDEIKNCDGRTFPNEFTIKIADDLFGKARILTFVHEISHTILCCQGRYFQKKFSQEEVCEFIAYALDDIERLTEQFVSEVGI